MKLLQHPAEKELIEFLTERLDRSATDSVEEHLDQCSECQAKIDSIVDNLVLFTRNDGSETSNGRLDSIGSKLLAQSPQDSTINMRFILLEEIARGGMGVVHRAFDRELKREIAVKISQDSSSSNRDIRFVREAQISAQLQHPGIVPVHQSGELKDGRQFIAMKVVNGQTLQSLLSQSDQTNVAAQYFKVFDDICNTMAYAHSKDIVHRDLKPANIMVGEFGEVQIMDWGLAKRLKESATDDANDELNANVDLVEHHEADSTADQPAALPGQTEIGKVLGTPAYMPPEQAKGESVDKRADVFAIGGILYQMLTGKPPFDAPTATMALARSCESDLANAFQALDEVNADKELIGLVKSYMAPEISDRPADAQSVKSQFGDYLLTREQSFEATKLEKARADERLAAQQKRNRQFAIFSTGIILAILAASVAGFLYFNEKNTRIINQAKRESALRGQQQELETKVVQSMAAARQMQLAAEQQAPGGDVENWVMAKNEVEKTASLAGQLTDAELKTQFADLRAAIQLRAQQSLERKDLLSREDASRDEIIQSMIDSMTSIQFRPFTDIEFLEPFEVAFGRIGITPGNLSEEIQSQISRSRFKDDFIAGLDVWRLELQKTGLASDQQKIDWIEELLRLADDNAFRVKVRSAFYDADREQLSTLAKEEAAVENLATVWMFLYRNRLFEADEYLEFTKRAQQRFPRDFRINWNLAATALNDYPGDSPERGLAVQVFLTCLSIQPDHPNVLWNVAVAYIHDKKYMLGIEAIEKLLKITPTFPEPYNNIAHAHFELGQIEKAIEYCNQGIKMARSHAPESLPKLLSKRGRYFRESGRNLKGIQDLEETLEIKPDPVFSVSHLAFLYQAEQRYEDAIELLTGALEVKPNYKPHQHRLSTIHMEVCKKQKKNGQISDAIESAKSAVKLLPERLDMRKELARLYMRTKQWDLAEQTLQDVLLIDKVKADTFAMLAELRLIRKQPEQSESLLREAIIEGTNSKGMQLELARALVAQGEDSKARMSEGVIILKRLAETSPEWTRPKAILKRLEAQAQSDESNQSEEDR